MTGEPRKRTDPEATLDQLEQLSEAFSDRHEVPSSESLRALSRVADALDAQSIEEHRPERTRAISFLAAAAVLLIAAVWWLSGSRQPTAIRMEEYLALLPDEKSRASFARFDDLPLAIRSLDVSSTSTELRGPDDGRWLLLPRQTVSRSRLRFRFLVRPIGSGEPPYDYRILVSHADGTEIWNSVFQVSRKGDGKYEVLSRDENGAPCPELVGLEEGRPLLEMNPGKISSWAPGAYSWKVRFDPIQHPDLQHFYAPVPVAFSIISDDARDELLSFESKFGESIDLLLRAATLNAHGMAMDTLAVLRHLPESASRDQVTFSRLLRCEALLILGDPQGVDEAKALLDEGGH